MSITLQDWGALAQVAATLVTLAGVLTSLWVALRTLREVQRDRKLRHKPYLAFQPGGNRLRIAFAEIGNRVSGVNPKYADKVLSHLPKNKQSVVLVRDGKDEACLYGELRNYGSGAAIDTHVTWVPERIWISGEEFEVNAEKLKEPLYSVALNHMPVVPRHIERGGKAQLTRLPALVIKDFDRKITRIEGHLLVECCDIFGEVHVAKQEFYFFTHYADDPPAVHVTFSDHTPLETNKSSKPTA